MWAGILPGGVGMRDRPRGARMEGRRVVNMKGLRVFSFDTKEAGCGAQELNTEFTGEGEGGFLG